MYSLNIISCASVGEFFFVFLKVVLLKFIKNQRKFIKSKLKFIKWGTKFIIIYNPHKVVLLVSKQDYTKVGHNLHKYYINALNNYTSVTHHLHYIL